MTTSSPRVATTSASRTPLAVAVVGGQGHRRQAEHQVGGDGPEDSAGDLGHDQRRRVPARHGSERALDQGHDRVERRRHGLQRQDQRNERRAGDDAVLQQLEPDIVRRQPHGRDAGADDRRDQKRGADELGQRPARQHRRHWQPQVPAAWPARAAARTWPTGSQQLSWIEGAQHALGFVALTIAPCIPSATSWV